MYPRNVGSSQVIPESLLAANCVLRILADLMTRLADCEYFLARGRILGSGFARRYSYQCPKCRDRKSTHNLLLFCIRLRTLRLTFEAPMLRRWSKGLFEITASTVRAFRSLRDRCGESPGSLPTVPQGGDEPSAGYPRRSAGSCDISAIHW